MICFTSKCKELKAKVQIARIDARADKKIARLENRSATSQAKSSAKATAYENGVDPNASKWAAISDLAKTTGSAAIGLGGLMSGKSTTANGGGLFSSTTSDVKAKAFSFTNPIVLIFAAIVVFLFMSKK